MMSSAHYKYNDETIVVQRVLDGEINEVDVYSLATGEGIATYKGPDKEAVEDFANKLVGFFGEPLGDENYQGVFFEEDQSKEIIDYIRLWHGEHKPKDCLVVKALNDFDAGKATFEKVYEEFMEADGSVDSLKQFLANQFSIPVKEVELPILAKDKEVPS